MKYILHYVSGSKGDFLGNFLNNIPFNIDKNTRKSFTHSPFILNYTESELDKIIGKNYKFFLTHIGDKIPKQILEKYETKIIKLNVEIKYFTTVYIDFHIKYYCSQTNFLNYSKIKNFENSKDSIKYKKIKYFIDTILIEKNLELNDTNRFLEIEKLLQNPNNVFYNYVNHNKNYDQVDKVLSYEDIYIRKKYDLLYEIKPDFDSSLFENLLEKTWLPDVMNVFDSSINLRKYGYRDY